MNSFDQRLLEAFQSSRYRPHGTASIRLDGNLVWISFEGPFNEEFWDRFLVARAKWRAETVVPAPLASVVEYKTSLLMTPAALERFSEVLNGARGRFHAIVITSDVEGRSTMLPIMQKVFDRTGLILRIFSDVGEAERWARTQLASGSTAPG